MAVLADAAAGDEAYGSEHVAAFGKRALRAVVAAFPDFVPQKTTVVCRGRRYEVNQYYEAHRETLDRCLRTFLQTHPVPPRRMTGDEAPRPRILNALMSVSRDA